MLLEISTKEDAVLTILKELDARHENVIRMYFGLGGESKTSIEEIGQDFDLTNDEVIESKNECYSCVHQINSVYWNVWR